MDRAGIAGRSSRACRPSGLETPGVDRVGRRGGRHRCRPRGVSGARRAGPGDSGAARSPLAHDAGEVLLRFLRPRRGLSRRTSCRVHSARGGRKRGRSGCARCPLPRRRRSRARRPPSASSGLPAVPRSGSSPTGSSRGSRPPEGRLRSSPTRMLRLAGHGTATEPSSSRRGHMARSSEFRRRAGSLFLPRSSANARTRASGPAFYPTDVTSFFWQMPLRPWITQSAWDRSIRSKA